MEINSVQEQSSKKSSRKGLWIILILIFVILLCVGSCVGLWAITLYAGDSGSSFSSSLSNQLETEVISGDASNKSKLLEIPINGPILNVKSSNDFLSFATQVTYGYEIKDLLVGAAKDPDIKGVLLEIDSPGGTITGSKAIADGVEYYRKQTGLPVYAHIIGMGASGAYWSAAATDYIIADTGSLVGSIGVILGPFKHYNTVLSEQTSSEGITTKDGIDTFYITSGGSKDVGTPDREMSAEERQVLQTGTDQAYEDFVDFVAERRKIKANTIINEIKALPYGEKQALAFKLIDKIGSRDLAYTELANKAGLTENNYQIVRVKTNTDFWSLLLGGDLLDFWSPSKAQTIDPGTELKGKMLYLYDEQQYLK